MALPPSEAGGGSTPNPSGTGMKQENPTFQQLQFLGFKHLLENWDALLAQAQKKQPSYHRFLTDIIQTEFQDKKEKARLARIKKANIPELLVLDTFPFSRQPRLKRKLVYDLYDSMRFMTKRQELIFIGPTGCGKTGLATSFLLQAIHKGYRGYFIDFRDLLERLRRALGDHTENKLLRHFQSYDIFLIDELGHDPVEKELAGLLFDLLKQRNRKYTTILTTQFGFDEWNQFLQNTHLTAALLDRLTVHCTVFNMNNCISIRQKNIVYATEKP
jgi:DNA replication protein DnaC